MSLSKYVRQRLIQELSFETSRSGGAGGQHANKTESRVTLVFDLTVSRVLSYAQKERLQTVLKSRINDGILRLSSEAERSQHRNKGIVIKQFFTLLSNSLIERKKRIPTTISKSKKESRLVKKKRHQDKKNLRKKIQKEDF
ncbi:aminoacyl-tRNA hydrolase [Crocinitomix catalasitica]|nr:aminoacyl-tRNA hydrolase [Crocinitomix catalasitica]